LTNGKTLVVGLGEVGGALAEVLSRVEPVLRHDIEPLDFSEPIDVMHLCFPFQNREQYETTALGYIRKFQPHLTIINSTVLPGTTSSLAQRSAMPVAYSPVRGKHARMTDDLMRYFKFVAASDPAIACLAEQHFQAAGMKTRRMNRVETLELAKLSETTYFGVLIAFAQEINRYCEALDGDYYEASEFFDEIDFLPRCRYFPGVIGGHCVIPNINLMLQLAPAPLLEAVLTSNQQRARELADGAPTAAEAQNKQVSRNGQAMAGR
jgi:UDP-N-acetyl-D-mannosaminuronate dehydrogenase